MTDEKKKTIIFRVDAGEVIGMGHFVRCYALAKHLSVREGARIVFAMKDGDQFAPIVENSGFEIFAFDESDPTAVLSQYPSDCAVVDIPSEAEGFVAAARDAEMKTVVIDDLGGKSFGSDFLVNGTVVDAFRDYPEDAAKKMLLGPKHMIIREEFAAVASGARWITKEVGSVFVSLGGEDPHGVINAIVTALEKIRFGGKVIIALGASFPDPDGFIKMTEGLTCRYEVLHNLPSIAPVMRAADIAVVNAGMTLYELACVGTPGLVVAMNEQQWSEAREFSRLGAVLNLGMWDVVDEQWLADDLQRLIDSRDLRVMMSEAGPGIIDGMGIYRIGRELLAEISNR